MRTAAGSRGGRAGDLPVPKPGTSVPAGVSDHAGSSGHSRWRARPGCPPHTSTASAPRGVNCRGSMAGLHAPLSTLRPAPRGARHMTRGRCGSLGLDRKRLSLSIPCRSPGALRSFTSDDVLIFLPMAVGRLNIVRILSRKHPHTELVEV
jgi:hypothetical protein